MLLGSLFIVSGISGSKVSDMAHVRAGAVSRNGSGAGTSRARWSPCSPPAAMADTVPPSIVLIVLGAVAGVSIAGLFQAGFVVAMVLLAALVVLARWKAAKTCRAPGALMKVVGRLILVAAPGLCSPS